MHQAIRAVARRAKTVLMRERIRYLTKLAWRKWHKKIFELHPEYRRPAPREIEIEHVRLWRQLRPRFSLDTLRTCFNISGIARPEIIPEEVYESEIELAINRYDICHFQANKSFYDRWLPGYLFPEVFLHNIDGEFYSSDYEPLSHADASRLLERFEYPLVFKPSMGSGGRDVHFPEDRQSLDDLMGGRRNFVVQRKIKPHPFFDRFTGYGLNTLRVCVYKSLGDNRLHVLNAALRMGKQGSLDNLTAGGIVRYIHPDGRLNAYALDNWGEKFLVHPDTGVDFAQREEVPNFAELKRLAKEIAQRLYLIRLVSFDFCMDEEARWRVVEVNLNFQTIQMAQYAGQPFFGQFTDEIIDYCKRNPRWALR
jgi:hypothetical protein